MEQGEIRADSADTNRRFLAFVSYSHRDARWARWLHRRIETFRLPRQLTPAGADRRVGKLFLDRSELATSSSLSTEIEQALSRAANLVVICSPAASQSRWVNEEIRRFRATGKGNRVFCLVVDGDPASAGEDGSFPPALLEPDTPNAPRPEPLAADVRPGKDRPNDALLKLIAGLLDVPFDALKRREQARRQRLWMTATAITGVLLVTMTGLAVAALLSQREAVRQQHEAMRQRNTAERTVVFLNDLFDEARPERTGGKEITVRSMVDRSADAAVKSVALQREPEVRIRLLTTLAGVYDKLRLPSRGLDLLKEARRYPAKSREANLFRLKVQAGLLTQSDNYDALRPVLATAFAMMASDARLQETYGPQLLIARAQLAEHDGRSTAAEQDYLAARQISLSANPPLLETATTALLAAAVADVGNGQLDRADTRLSRVIIERTASGQSRDPDVLTAYNELGTIAFKRGDPRGAERWFRHTIDLQQQIYGSESLDVALSRSNLGRALVEQRRFAEAKKNLLAARPVYLKEVGNRADVLANLEDSLGLAETGLNDPAAAEASFKEGLIAARANQMPKEVELLTDLAELQCGEGQTGAGLATIAAARTSLTAFAMPEPWRRARVDNVAGGCLLAAGDRAGAAKLIRQSTPLVLQHWGPDTLFGVAARRRRAALDR